MNPLEFFIFLFKPNVMKLTAREDVKGLTKALKFGIRFKNEKLAYKAYMIRETAADVLGEFGDSRAIEPLMQFLENEKYSDSAILKGIDSLMILDKEWAKLALIGLLNNPFYEIRVKAAEMLGSLSADNAVDALIIVLNDEHPFVREASAKALGDINNDKAIKPLVNAQIQWGGGGHNVVFYKAIEKFGKKVIPYLTAELKNISSYKRLEAAGALSVLQWQPETEDEKIDFLVANKDFAALTVLGEKGVLVLINLLNNKNEDSDVRMAVTKALGEIGTDQCVQALIGALKDNDGGVQNHAAIALGEIGDKKAVDPLIDILNTIKDRTGTGGVLVYAIKALGKIGDTKAVEPLTSFLGASSSKVSGAAQMAIDSIQGTGDWVTISESIKELAPVSKEKIEGIEKECSESNFFIDPSEIISELERQFENYYRIAGINKKPGLLKIIFDNFIAIGHDVAPPTRELEINIVRLGNQYHVFYNGKFLG